MEAVFRADGRSVLARSHAAGPWSPSMQHGGAASSLVTWAAEAMPTPAPMQVVRITVDLMRPVPIGELELTTELLREGRKIQLCGVSIRANGVEVVRGSVLKVRRADMDTAGDIPASPDPEAPFGRADLDLPLPQDCPPMDQSANLGNPFIAGLDTRSAKGGFRTPGPGAVWFRALRPMIEGGATSPAMRAAIAGDFCNGVSSLLDFDRWTFLNADLTISLAREPVGQWVLLNAETWLGPDGSGIAMGRLADERGYFGRAVQSLVIEPRG